MKPEKFIGIMIITLLLSCEMEDQVEVKTGEVVFESNQYIVNSIFELEAFIDGKSIGMVKGKLNKKLPVGVHDYQVKVYTFNGDSFKSINGKIIVSQNKKSEIFIDFRDYNSWI